MLGEPGRNGQPITAYNSQIKSECRPATPTDRVPRRALHQLDPGLLARGAAPGTRYEHRTPTVCFSQAVNTGCGQADSGVGPFYCPADNKVYIDLRSATSSAAVRCAGGVRPPYVLAHEYGHHVQDLVGTEAEVRRQRRAPTPECGAARVAGRLLRRCVGTSCHRTDANGRPIITITQQDINEALDAAAQSATTPSRSKMGRAGRRSQFTHGSSAQRQKWFTPATAPATRGPATPSPPTTSAEWVSMSSDDGPRILNKKAYIAEEARLQGELVAFQEWIRTQGLRLIVIFEGRDTAGKGGTIKRITARLNPRWPGGGLAGTRPSANAPSGTSSATSRTCPQPARSSSSTGHWYNRAGVERVMGFCTDQQYDEFARTVPLIERVLIRAASCWSSTGSLSRRRAAAPVPGADRRPVQAVEAQPDGPGGAGAVGRLRRGEGRHVRASATRRRARGG